MTNKEKIEDLLKIVVPDADKDTVFEMGSEWNGICCILSGYSLFIDLSVEELKEYLEELFPKCLSGYTVETMQLYTELNRVYEYAKFKDYGKWWEIEENYEEFFGKK